MRDKIHILFEFKENELGGGNNFLISLRENLKALGKWASFWEADIVLFNSHHFGKFNHFFLLLLIKKILNRRTIFIHRIDGSLFIGRNDERYKMADMKIWIVNRLIATKTFFQSNWSLDIWRQTYPRYQFKNCKVVHNYPRIYFSSRKRKNKCDKIKFVYTSWSNNDQKGFDTLTYLDKFLDYTRIEFSYIGRLPTGLNFKNINVLGILKNEKIRDVYESSDVFLALMKNDACSNALIEAQAAGMYIYCLDSGGNKELVHSSTRIFKTKEQLLNMINEDINKSCDFRGIQFSTMSVDNYMSFLLS